MTERENLDLVSELYSNDPFERENVISLNEYADRCIRYATDKTFWLELGLGHGHVVRRMSEAFGRVLVLDGAPELVRRYSGQLANVEIKLTYFEDYATEERFSNISMGFVLEHVDDPAFILKRFSAMLAEDGAIYAGVPSASSLHRLIAHQAGLLPDIRSLTETDRRFGHKRHFTYDDWVGLFGSVGLRIERAEGMYLKPLAAAQMEALKLDPRIYKALPEVAKDQPSIANTLFFLLKMA